MSNKAVFAVPGFATLPTVIVLSLLILIVVVSLAAIGYSENVVSSGFQQSSRALYYAESGVRESLERIARDTDYSTTSYSFDVIQNGCLSGDGCAILTVSTSTYPKIIYSEGVSKTATRRVRADVYLGTTSTQGEIQSVVWHEFKN